MAMKIVILLLVMFFGISSVQGQGFTFSDDSFTYLVQVNDDAAIGGTAFSLTTFSGDAVNYDDIIGNIAYNYVGIDSSGTVYLMKNDNDYSVESEKSSNLLVTPNKTLTFSGHLGSPDLEISIQEIEGGKVSVTLVNAEAFEAFTE